MNTIDLIHARLSQPLTHDVVTTYADGRTRSHGARDIGAAKNFASGERRKIGKALIDRDTLATVRVVSVEIVARG